MQNKIRELEEKLEMINIEKQNIENQLLDLNRQKEKEDCEILKIKNNFVEDNKICGRCICSFPEHKNKCVFIKHKNKNINIYYHSSCDQFRYGYDRWGNILIYNRDEYYSGVYEKENCQKRVR